MRLRAASATDVGVVRTNNEDELLLASPLFAVADGMGGHAAGEVASRVAIEALRVGFDGNRTADGLAEAVRSANRAVFARGRDEPELRGMGTTLTATALVEEDGQQVLAVAHVGDSRMYLLRDGELTQITDDHSLVGEMVRSGQVAADEASTHPQRHIVTRALGIEPEVEVDCFRVDPFRGDRLLLASDGLSDEVREDQIASVLRRLADPDEAVKELVRAAKANGGHDNITVVLIDVVDDDDKAEAASAALADTKLPSQSQRDARLREIADDDRPSSVVIDQETFDVPRRRMTARVLLFLLALAVLIGGALAAVGWYARASYYVGLQGERVAIFKGRPGGLLWFDPTLSERTELTTGDLPPSRVDILRVGKVEPSLDDARRYVANLEEEAASLQPPPTTTTTLAPTPPATVPPPVGAPAGPNP